MGLFSRKSQRSQTPAPDSQLPAWAGSTWEAAEWREFPAPADVVVGEGRRQEVLQRITGPPRAEGYEVPINVTLIREPDNEYDSNAIAVYLSRNDDPDTPKFVDGSSMIGYIEADFAADFAPLVDKATGSRSGGAGGIPGVVVGGWPDAPHFGVKLFLSAIAEQFGLDEELLYEYSSPLFDGQAELGDDDEDEDEEVDDSEGGIDGRHYTEFVEEVKQLKREERYEEALALLGRLMDATEREAATNDFGVAPWYYEQAAIIYRKLGQRTEEIAVLERYEAQPHGPGAKPTALADRLSKLLANS